MTGILRERKCFDALELNEMSLKPDHLVFNALRERLSQSRKLRIVLDRAAGRAKLCHDLDMLVLSHIDIEKAITTVERLEISILDLNSWSTNAVIHTH